MEGCVTTIAAVLAALCGLILVAIEVRRWVHDYPFMEVSPFRTGERQLSAMITFHNPSRFTIHVQGVQVRRPKELLEPIS